MNKLLSLRHGQTSDHNSDVDCLVASIDDWTKLPPHLTPRLPNAGKELLQHHIPNLVQSPTAAATHHATSGCAIAGGRSIRSVKCMRSSDAMVSNSLCLAPQPAASMACNVQPCNFCHDNVCSGQGSCRGQFCQCNMGYSGQYCEVPCSQCLRV